MKLVLMVHTFLLIHFWYFIYWLKITSCNQGEETCYDYCNYKICYKSNNVTIVTKYNHLNVNKIQKSNTSFQLFKKTLTGQNQNFKSFN